MPPLSHQGQQLDLGRVGVGQLVDVDVCQAAALGREQPRIVGQQAGGRPHQLRRVVGRRPAGGRVAQREHGDVLPQEAGRRRPVVAAQPLAEPGQLDRPDPALRRPLHEVAQLLGERPGGQRRTQRLGPPHGVLDIRVADRLEELADDEVLLRAGQQARRGLTALGGGPPQQPEGVRVERAHQGLVEARPGDAGLDPVPQRRRAAAAEREHQDAFRVDAGGDPLRDGLDEHRCLARAGPAHHEQRSVGVLDHVALERVVAQPRHGRGGAPDEPVRRPANRTGSRGHGTNETTRV
nr:hypothetical protein GCM10020092_012970 [Actinoplanes digitatis]